MNKSGFTLVELLIAVLIIGTLSAIALPKYSISVERARTTEATSMVQQTDDAIYAYYAEHSACPSKFSQLAVTLPVDGKQNVNSVVTKNFMYGIDSKGAKSFLVPGTDCPGSLATRWYGSEEVTKKGKYTYYIWRNRNKSSFYCKEANYSEEGAKKGVQLCKLLDLYTDTDPV